MGWSIELDDAAVTLDQFTFDPEWVLVPAGNGAVDAQEFHLSAKGVITGATAATIAARAIVLSEMVSEQISPVHVEIKLDGTTQWDFPVNEFNNSPLITRFKLSSEEDGSGESYWKWELEIYATKSGRGDGTTEFDTSLEVVKQNGKVVKKIWRAEAKSSSVSSAESKVRSFAPSEEEVRESVQLFYQQDRAIGAWIWEARTKGLIISVDETVEITGDGDGWEFDRQVNADGTALPILHKKPKSGVTTIIKGFVRGFGSDIEIPAPHFSSSDIMKRDGESEVHSDIAIPDGEEGIKHSIYKREYMEVWKSQTYPGTLDHGWHVLGAAIEAPPDGPIAGSR